MNCQVKCPTRIEAQGVLQIRNRLQRRAVVDVADPAHAEGQREVGVERQRLLHFLAMSGQILFPELHDRGYRVRIGQGGVLLERQPAVVPDSCWLSVRPLQWFWKSWL